MSYPRIFDILHHQLANYPLEDTFARREDGKNWRKYSTQEIIDLSDALSTGLMDLGLKKDDKIAFIFTTNRPEWHILDMATLQLGIVNVPIYPNITTDEYRYILKHAEVKYLFVSNKTIYNKVAPILSALEQLKGVYTFDHIDGVEHWSSLLSKTIKDREIEAIKATIQPAELATIIYTSGTTGEPKGVMLSHENIMSNVLDAAQMVPVQSSNRAYSFLPLCHVFERILNYTYMHQGASVYFADGLEKIAIQLPDVRPQYFAVVPRILEKIFEGIERKAKKLSPFKRKLFQWSVKIAVDTPIYGKITLLQKFRLWVADIFVFKKWRTALGGNTEAIICGSAPLSPYLCRTFTNAGIPVLEGYGLTETSPVLTVNPLSKGKIHDGTVGVTLPSVQLEMAQDGEILVKGPNVMMGYYKDKVATQESFTPDGWLKTGDIGHFTFDQYLVITDRKKELLKTSGGKYVAPAPIENRLKESPFIEQVVVVGDGMKFVGVLIVPNFGALKEWCSQNSVIFTSNQAVIEEKAVEKLYFNIVQDINTNFSKVEQIKKVALLEKEWTVESGELTATMKIRRKVINEKYKEIINKFYK